MAHGELASAFHDTLQMIVGEVNHFYPVNFYRGEGPDHLKARIEEVLDAESGEDYIIFTDLYGGTPFNVATIYSAKYENVTTITGMNLPMMLELAFIKEGDRPELVAQAVANAKEGVREFVFVEEEADDSESADDEF